MKDLSMYLPTENMRADFERFKSMTPEERAVFQEQRAQKIEAMSESEKQAFTDATRKGLDAIKGKLQDILLK